MTSVQSRLGSGGPADAAAGNEKPHPRPEPVVHTYLLSALGHGPEPPERRFAVLSLKS